MHWFMLYTTNPVCAPLLTEVTPVMSPTVISFSSVSSTRGNNNPFTAVSPPLLLSYSFRSSRAPSAASRPEPIVTWA
ncbi:MAG: hypothetical protein LBR46_02220 [Prevotella sp.]|nr:hypothetical protein [Prevotella sp.]